MTSRTTGSDLVRGQLLPTFPVDTCRRTVNENDPPNRNASTKSSKRTRDDDDDDIILTRRCFAFCVSDLFDTVQRKERRTLLRCHWL